MENIEIFIENNTTVLFIVFAVLLVLSYFISILAFINRNKHVKKLRKLEQKLVTLSKKAELEINKSLKGFNIKVSTASEQMNAVIDEYEQYKQVSRLSLHEESKGYIAECLNKNMNSISNKVADIIIEKAVKENRGVLK